MSIAKAISIAKAAAKAGKFKLSEPQVVPKYKGSPPADILAATPARRRRHGVRIRRRSVDYAEHQNKIAEIAKKR